MRLGRLREGLVVLAALGLLGAAPVPASSFNGTSEDIPGLYKEYTQLWGSFEKSGTTHRPPYVSRHDTVRLFIIRPSQTRPKPGVVAVYDNEVYREGKPTVIRQWADTRTCESLQPTIDRLGGLPPFVIVGPNSPPPPLPPYEFPPPSDISYAFHGRIVAPQSGIDAKIDVGDSVTGPFAQWIDDAFEKLGPCWSETPPKWP